MNNIIQPFIFEQPIDIPKPNKNLIILNRIYNTDNNNYQSKPNYYEPKISSNYNNRNIEHNINKNDNISINIDTNNTEKPLKLKLDLFLVDVEISPKVPKIIKFIENLF